MSMPTSTGEPTLERIRQQLPQLPEAQRRVGAYLMDNYAVGVFMSSTQLAQAAGSSQASVTRFVNALGHKSYAEFQRTLSQGLLSRLEEAPPVRRFEGAHADTSALLEREAHHLRGLNQVVRSAAFGRCAQRLSGARSVLIAGFGAAAPAALHAGLYLSRLRPNVQTVTSLEAPNLVQLVHFGQPDYLLMFAVPRYPRETQTLLELMRFREVPAGLVINKASHPLTGLAGEVLLAPVTNSRTTVFPVSTLALASLLVDAAAQQQPERTLSDLETFETLANQTQYFVREK